MQLCMTGRLKSIYKFEEKQVADTSVKKKTMQSSELESGLPDEAEQECIVFFLFVGCRELNHNKNCGKKLAVFVEKISLRIYREVVYNKHIRKDRIIS